MKSLLYLSIAGVIGVGAASADQGRGQAKSRGDVVVASRTSAPAVSVSIVFAPQELAVIRTHYASRYRNLPPGLQKKLARGGTLPPGWQKKMEPFPAALERDLIILPGGHRRGVIEGHAVIYHPITHAILDIASLF